MKKNRKENERTIRTFCACAEILLRNEKFSDATKKWKIGHEPVRFALRSVTRKSILEIERSLESVRSAMNDARIALDDATRKSNDRKILRSPSGCRNRKRKPIQKTLFG